MSSSKAVVGVPADRRIVGIHPFHMVGEKYLRAIIDGANALPLVVPVLADDIEIDAVLSQVDGIFFTGSPSDIEPHRYDGEPSAPETLHDAHRDELTLPMARRALERGVPVLAVCRGFQELNVALGGSLHQKVHEVPGYHMHKENPDDDIEVQYGPSHEVNLVAGGAPACNSRCRECHGEVTAWAGRRQAGGQCDRGGSGRSWSGRSFSCG